MRHCLRILFLLILFSGLMGCGRHSPYPNQWPKILESPSGGCNNISGVYSDKEFKTGAPLTRLLVYGGSTPQSDKEALRVISTATHVIVIQSDKTVELKIMANQETLLNKTLTIGKDVFCADGLHVVVSGSVFGEGVIGYGKSDCNLLLGEDGSLVVNFISSGFGAYGCLIPIIVVSDSTYHRFEKYTPK